MRDLVLRGGPWSDAERSAILDYCESDVAALARLLPAMLPNIDLPRALLRGRYMAAAAQMERNGVPIDIATLERLRQHWSIFRIGSSPRSTPTTAYTKGEHSRLTVSPRGLPTTRFRGQGSTAAGLTSGTTRSVRWLVPTAVAPLRELRNTLSGMRLIRPCGGQDGRNRTMLSAFRARTGRNQPSNTRFIFGPSVWLRGLIKPPPGYGIAYIDWQQQEFGIAAALSGDA